MAWIALLFAGLFEVAGALALKSSRGFTRPMPSALVLAAFAVSFWLLSAAAATIAIGTAYAVWTGIGAAGTAIVGMLWLGEASNQPRVASLLLVVLGSAGMKLLS
jgi:quaternary ammonium compound-resistance protein SugE